MVGHASKTGSETIEGKRVNMEISISRAQTIKNMLINKGYDGNNIEVFGKCANKNWHGHNYTLFVTVEGTVDPDTGYVIDLKILSDIIKDRIVDKMDHKNLNLEVDFMKDTITTAENIAIKIYEELEGDIHATGNKLPGRKIV